MRKHYLDNVRFITVILVLVYHVAFLFNNAGVLGGIGADRCVTPMNAILYFAYPWFIGLPDIMIYAIALVGEFVLTPLCYEIMRRIPVIRYLVQGITKRKKADPLLI